MRILRVIVSLLGGFSDSFFWQPLFTTSVAEVTECEMCLLVDTDGLGKQPNWARRPEQLEYG